MNTGYVWFQFRRFSLWQRKPQRNSCNLTSRTAGPDRNCSWFSSAPSFFFTGLVPRDKAPPLHFPSSILWHQKFITSTINTALSCIGQPLSLHRQESTPTDFPFKRKVRKFLKALRLLDGGFQKSQTGNSDLRISLLHVKLRQSFVSPGKKELGTYVLLPLSLCEMLVKR